MTLHGVGSSPGAARLARGAIWVAIVALATRFLGLLTQIVAGWRFDAADFAAYAAAFSATSFMLPLADSSMGKLLIQRGANYAALARGFLLLSVGLNLLTAGIMFGVLHALNQADVYSVEPVLAGLLLGGFVLGAGSSIFKARLAIDLAFAAISRINMYGSVLQNVLASALILADFGPLALALAFLAARAFELLLFRRRAGATPTAVPALTTAFVGEVFRDLKWILLAAFSTVAIMQGEYVVLGLKDPDALGLYFFAGQLSLSIVAPITVALQSVLLPAFTRFGDDISRVRSAYQRATQAMQLAATPVCVLGVLLCDVVVDVLWSGKWNAAVALIEIMLVATLVRCVNPIGRSVLEARGGWRTQSTILLTDALGTFAVAWVAVPFGLVTVALAILGWRVAVNLLQGMVVAQTIGMPLAQGLRLLLAIPLLGIVTGACAAGLGAWLPGVPGGWVREALVAAGFCLLYGALGWIIYGATAREIIVALAGRRRSSAVPTVDEG